MSYIRVRGAQFEINGEIRPYRMRTSFCLLAHYQRGNRDVGRRWLDRLKLQGFDGPRLFGENQDWSGGPFFGSSLTPIVRAFGNHSGPFSKLKLVDGYKEIVWQLGEDLREREMVAEFCCIATVKGREAGWTAHGLNKFAQMFRELYPADNTPFLHETVNEIDAHAPHLDDKTEWARMGPRWRRSDSDPSHHNYPGSTIGVSAGGQFMPGFDDLGYTHRNIHPPRGPFWDRGVGRDEEREPIESTLSDLKRKNMGRPLAFNETVHYMTPEQWEYWVDSGKIYKWHGLSTKNVSRLTVYTDTVLRSGVSFCAHDYVGMMTDPDAAFTPMEREWGNLFGGSPPVDPGEPGDPGKPTPSVVPFAHVVVLAYKQILLRTPSEEEVIHYNDLMAKGLSEADMREAMVRSDEFKSRWQ